MTFLLIILTITASTIIIGQLFKKKDSGSIYILGAVLSCISSINGTTTGCRDGWNSSNIGSQGACSWHGGVVTQLNDFGEILTTISIIVIVLKFYFAWVKVNK